MAPMRSVGTRRSPGGRTRTPGCAPSSTGSAGCSRRGGHPWRGRRRCSRSGSPRPGARSPACRRSSTRYGARPGSWRVSSSRSANCFEEGRVELQRLMERERGAARLDGEAGDIGARIAAARSRIAELQLQVLQFDANRIAEAEGEAREAQARETQVRERLVSVRARLAHMEVRAPISGEVFEMQVFAPAEVVRPAEPILKIVPEDAALVGAGDARSNPCRSGVAGPGGDGPVPGVSGADDAGLRGPGAQGGGGCEPG